MAVNLSTLFTKLGRLFYAGNTIQTALQTTIEDEVEDAVQAIGGANPVEYEVIRDTILNGLRSLQANCVPAQQNCVATPAERLLVQMVKTDVILPDETLDMALSELISQMDNSADKLDGSTPAVSVSYDADNVGNGLLVTSVRRPDGKLQQFPFDETIEGTFLNEDLTLLGEPFVSTLSYNWPGGSGSSNVIATQDSVSGDNVIINGDFETADENATDLPQYWIVSIGTLASTINLTPVEIQRITITDTPTAGYYLLHWVDDEAKLQTTAPLPYNASGSEVQSALRSLVGLENITVDTSGSSPNYTHEITFTGVTNPNQLTSTNATVPGNIAHSTYQAASAYVFKGACSLEFDSNGVQLTTIQTSVVLDATTQYAVNLWAICDVVPVSGVITVELVDGIGGSVVADDEGFRNTCHFNAASLTTSFRSLDALVAAVNEVQTVTITESPGGGTFTLTYDDQTTAAIAYDASAAVVEAALELLSNIGSGNVTCANGPLPGTPVTITFQNDLAARDVLLIVGDGSELTLGSPSQSPSSSPSESASASPSASPSLSPSASESPSSSPSLSPSASTSPSSSPSASVSESPSASPSEGESASQSPSVSQSLSPSRSPSNSPSRSPSASVSQSPSQSSSASPSVSPSVAEPQAVVTLTTEGCPASPVFRTPTNMPEYIYLRIRISTAIPEGTSMYIDEVCMVPMTQLYVGGPSVAMFSGSEPWDDNDLLSLTVTNDRAGAIEEWCDRVWLLREKNLLLPCTLGGSETIADSLIA